MSALPEAPGSGWHAELRLGLERRGARTVLARRHQRGPLAVQRPFHPEGDLCHLYLLHPPGGVVGGDRLEIAVAADPGAAVLLTTPGATKFYRSAGPLAVQRQTLEVADDAVLEWLPQENILFPGAALRLETRIALAAGARFVGWEFHCLGRPAVGERFDSGSAELRLEITRDDRPLLRDRLPVTPGTLDGPAGLRGHPVVASLVATPADAALLEAVRALLACDPVTTGATLLDDLLVVRALGDATEPLRRLFTRLWRLLRPAVVGRAPCPPRIWST